MSLNFQDLRFGARMLRKNPGFTGVAVLTLALGIAVNSAVFSWIQAVLLRPLPGVADSSTLVAFETVAPDGGFILNSYPDYRDYRERLTSIAGLAVAAPVPVSVGEEGRSERVWSEMVSGNYFEVLGVRPLLGRVFTPAEYGHAAGGYPVAVIGESLWDRMFQRDPAIVGRTIRINRQQLTVAGVAPASFRGSLSGVAFELWIPVVMAQSMNAMPEWMLRDRQTRMHFGLARLKPGVTPEQAAEEARGAARQLAREHPDTNQGISVAIMPLAKAHFGAQDTLGGPLTMLMAVCGVVLLIVCANVANLLLARAAARRKEFGMRLALGAGRGRILRQLLIENLILGVLALAAGIPLAVLLSRSLGYLVPATAFPVMIDVRLDAQVLAFTVVLCVATCIVAGMLPLRQTMRVDLNDTLREAGRGASSGERSRRARTLLVVAEVALALVAIISAGLFARSFQMARRIDPGFNPNGVLVSHLYLAAAGYSVPERIQFCARLRERLESQPGLEAVAYADYIPLGFADGSWEDLQIEGYVPRTSENMKLYRTVISPGYFRLMHIPLVEGRDFTEQDDTARDSVMIVNQRFARTYFGGANPIGRKVHGWGKWFTVVGVSGDTKYHQPNEPPRPLFYVPFRQVYREDLGIAFYARTRGDDGAALAALRREVQGIDPNVNVYDAISMNEFISASWFAQKIAASILGALSAIALLLSAVGLYSVMAYSVTQRTKEIGIRMAFGADRSRVLALVLRQAMTLVLVGIAAGAAVAAIAARLASRLLVGVSPTDPWIFLGGALFLSLVGLLATCVPAIRATRIDPNAALHCQ